MIDGNILSRIKYERVHAYRISTNYLVDSLATKKCFDYFTGVINEEKKGENYLNGFLQESSLIPFGLFFICQQQASFIIFTSIYNIVNVVIKKSLTFLVYSDI